MNSFVKGQILSEIRDLKNTIQRNKVGSEEQFVLLSPTGRVMVDIVNTPDKYLCRVGGEEMNIDKKDFEDIMMEFRICYAPNVGGALFEEQRPKISPDVFRIKKEK